MQRLNSNWVPGPTFAGPRLCAGMTGLGSAGSGSSQRRDVEPAIGDTRGCSVGFELDLVVAAGVVEFDFDQVHVGGFF
jgi:hypothetical protein